MRLKEKGEILMDTGKYKEVPCNHFQMTFGDTTLQLLAHKTEQAWAPQQDLLDVSEKLTGYRFTTTGKSVSSSSMKDVERVVKEFVEEHTIEKINDKIAWFLKNSNRVIA